MNTRALHWLGRSLIVVAVLVAGCRGEAPAGPDRRPAIPMAGSADRAPDLSVCGELQAPAGTKLASHVYAAGVQIYRWNGASWGFVAPSATLSADAGGKSTVGIHYEGPTWESNSGGTVVGSVQKRCTPTASAIAWLSLAAVPDGGPGVFHRVTFIQRVNTVGGNAPSNPGSFTGEEARVPYTAEYFFYRWQ